MLKNALLSGCVLGVCSSLFDFSCVSEKHANQIKQIISLIFIVIIASAILKTDTDKLLSLGTSDIIHNNEYSSVMSDAVCEQTEKNIREYILSLLSDEGINDAQISIQLTVNKDNLIELESIGVALCNEDKNKAGKVRRLVSQAVPQGELSVSWEGDL